jgi:hypothetical protein
MASNQANREKQHEYYVRWKNKDPVRAHRVQSNGSKRARARDPEKFRAAARKRRCEDITPEAVAIAYERQEGKCGVCREMFTVTPHADHDHQTGLFRGLLCQACNRGLGLFKDQPVRLRLAAEYIEAHLRSRK